MDIHKYICRRTYSFLLGICLRSGISGPGKHIFSLTRELPNIFLKWLYQFILLLTTYESYSYITSSPTLFISSCSSGCMVVSHWGFGWLSPRWLTMLGVLLLGTHLPFFVKCLVKSFDCCFLSCLSFCVDLEEFFTYIRYDLLSNVCTVNILSHSVASLLYFIFLMMSFDE